MAAAAAAAAAATATSVVVVVCSAAVGGHFKKKSLCPIPILLLPKVRNSRQSDPSLPGLAGGVELAAVFPDEQHVALEVLDGGVLPLQDRPRPASQGDSRGSCWALKGGGGNRGNKEEKV